MNVRLNIERIVLEGPELSAGAVTRLERSLGRQLGRLIDAGGLPAEAGRARAASAFDGGTIDGGRTRDPRRLGTALARVVYAGMRGIGGSEGGGRA